MVRLLVVDDHSYLIRGIEATFKDDKEIGVVASADTGFKAMEQLKLNTVDVVLLDILMPEMNGIECCKQIKDIYPEIKIIAFTGELDTEVLSSIWNCRVNAILLKSCSLEELKSTINAVMNNQRIIGNDVPCFIEYNSLETSSVKLTRRETEVLNLLSLGLSRKEVANKLDLNVETVHFHCKNIFRKLNTNKIKTAISEAKEARIIR